jgi:hypothetical protein
MNQFRYANPGAVQQRGASGANAQAAAKTIPFDYVFQFTLLGQRGNKVQDVIEISTEGVFVALSIGYSLILDERRTPRTFGPGDVEGPILLATTTNRPLAQITLGEIAAGLEKLEADLTLGFRLSPEALGLFASDQPFNQLPREAQNRVFETGRDAAEEVSFLYSLDVSGTGREYQSRPIHNIAGLGIANGDRPFRPFAKPLLLEPKSSLRIQVEELSGPAGTLFIVLQGYKMLGTGRIPG